MVFGALSPQTIFSLTSIKVLYVCSISVFERSSSSDAKGSTAQISLAWRATAFMFCGHVYMDMHEHG